jgi:signal transduction histidine kinase
MDMGGARRVMRGRSLLIGALVGVMGIATADYSARSLQREEDLRIATQFAARAEGWRGAIQREADLFLEVLESLRHLHTLSSAISREAFAEFESKGLAFARAELGGFGFAQRIDRASRANFESPMPSDGSRMVILERGSAGLQPAADRETWYPIVHADPDELAPLGFDLGSDPGQRDRIAMAIERGAAVVGAPFLSDDPLVLTPILELRFDAVLNAYGVEVRGLAFAWLQPQRLLARALPERAAESLQAELRAPGAASVLSGADGEPDFSGEVRIADQRWRFRARAADGHLARQRTGHAGMLRAAGVALAAMAGFLAWSAASYTERARRLVKLRTADLEHEREERTRLEHELLEVGRRERQRVGQDLHDSLGQKLAGAAMLARAASQAPEAAARAQMTQVAEVVKDSLTQVRRIARGLAPMDLDNAGLGDALRRLSDEACDLHGVACSAEAAAAVHPRDAGAALHLYQIAQEAIANAVRHGAATEIRITLGRTAAGGALTICDNGRGLPPDVGALGGLGLRLMRHRAALFGGSVEVRPGEAGGTMVRCAFPLAAK